ncbi:unnamed protein product [Psylliodes chrysocephalus]|uniref:Uncharacterized protein n=1 Tax=Psylliodes chrysocephalus TaxID=3402493 RepID=A0A9P0CJP3_9CUCU|nr:unnamed protein product [Psylliodes chrysocephala]
MSETDSSTENVDKFFKSLPHNNYAGREVAVRVTGMPCRCCLKCYEMFFDQENQEVLATVNSFNDKNTQDIYIQSLIEVRNVQDIRKRGEEPKKPKTRTFKYHINLNGKRATVCK